MNSYFDGTTTVSDEGMNAYFDTINAKRTVYENLLNEAPMLFQEQFGLVHGTVLDILSFLQKEKKVIKQCKWYDFAKRWSEGDIN